MKKAILIVLILILLTGILPLTAVADKGRVFTVNVINSRQETLTQDIVLIQDDEVFMTPQSLCEETGFSVSQSGDIIQFSRSTKTVEVNLNTSLIIFGGICDSLDIIEKDGQIWLSMEKMLHFLNARCLFTDGTLIVHAASYTVDEMVAAFMPIMTNGYNKKNVYEHGTTGQTTRAVIGSWLWDLVRHPVKQLRSIVSKDYSDMFVDMVRADEHSDLIYDVFKDADTHVSFANKLISLGQKYPDAMPDILKRFGDIDAVKSITSGLDRYSQVTDIISMDDLMDGIKYISITYTQNYAYTDAVKYGFVEPYEDTFEKEYSEMYTDAKNVVLTCEKDRPTLATVCEAMGQSVTTTILESGVDNALTAASLPISVIRKTADYVMDLTGFNDANKAFSDMQDLSKFQNFSFDTFFNTFDQIMASPLNADEERILKLKYSGLLFIRVAMMYDHAVGVSTSMLERQFVDLTRFADEDILLDDLGYMPEYNIDADDMLALCEGSGISADIADSGNTGSSGRGNTSGNIANGGIAAESDGWIYYRSNDGGSVYKMKNDGTGNTKLNSDNSKYINVVGDTVIYQNRDDGDTIYAMDTDGGSRTRLNSEQSYLITVLDGWIYYNTGRTAMRMRLDGSQREVVSDMPYITINGTTMIVTGSTDHYDDKTWPSQYGDIEEILYTVDVGTGTTDKLYFTTWSNGCFQWGFPHFADSQLYFAELYGSIAEGNLYAMDVPNKYVSCVSGVGETTFTSINVSGGNIYAAVIDYFEDTAYIEKLTLDGQTVGVIDQKYPGDEFNAFGSVCIAGDWIFYADPDGIQYQSANAEFAPQPIVASDYLIPGSDSRYITMADLSGFDAWTARLARNEIFARYGFTFTTSAIQAYFNGTSWYVNNPNVNKNNSPELSDIELYNIGVIKEYEKRFQSDDDPQEDDTSVSSNELVGTWVVDDSANQDAWQMTLTFSADGSVLVSRKFNGQLRYDYGSWFLMERTGSYKITNNTSSVIEGGFTTPENNHGSFHFTLNKSEDRLYVETQEGFSGGPSPSNYPILECRRR